MRRGAGFWTSRYQIGSTAFDGVRLLNWKMLKYRPTTVYAEGK